jgi:SPP1 gp7 family putative phage head morphogenesis protein
VPLFDLFRNRKVAQLQRDNQALLQRVASLEARSPAVIISAAAQYASAFAFTSGNREAKLLRMVADQSPIVRAAINAKKRHISQLEFAISGDNETTKADLARVLNRPFPGGNWRKLVSMVIEDVMVLDAGALYIWPNRGGGLYGLLPIDGNTIVPLVQSNGILPEPPEIAYEQYIAGAAIAQLTTNDMTLLEMNPRTWSLSGLSSVEAVLLAVGVMLQRLTNISSESDSGNVPAFFGEVPDGWTRDQTTQWQEYWDAMTAGESHRGVWGPKGSDVTFPPARTFDVAFDEWLLKVVCAVMEVQPQELGFTADVNRATGSSQEIISQRRSVRPLALLIKEAIDHAFEVTGNEGYTLTWPTLDARDRGEIREDAKTFVPLGVMTPNDIRTELGLEDAAWGDEPLKQTSPQISPTGDSGVARTLSRAKRKPLNVVPLDDNAEALKIEARLRAALQAAFVKQHVVIERLLQGIEVPADLNALDDDAVDTWASREMADRLGKRKVKRAAGDAAADDDWESLLTPTFMEALKELATYGAEAGANALTPMINIDWSLTNPDVARWARKYSSLLVGRINDTTWRGLKDGLAEWVMSKESYDDLVKRFEVILDDPKRADLVASTESTRAYAQGNRIVWQKTNEEYGLKIKRMWLTANDERVCPICGGLDGQTVDLDEPFVLDGVEYDSQPAHPRCRCDGAAVVD